MDQSTATTPAASAAAIIPIYPLTDTVAILAILVALPKWLGVVLLLTYVSLGSSKFVRSTLSLVFRHKLDGLENKTLPSLSTDSQDNSRSSAAMSAFGALTVDFVLTLCLLTVSPNLLDYLHLLAKAFVASNLASTKHRYVLNAVLASVLILSFENTVQIALRYISESTPSRTLSEQLFYHTYLRYPKQPLKLLLHNFYPAGPGSRRNIILGFDHMIAFLYSSLSIYTIMHNINPLLRKLVFYNNISKQVDNLTSVSIPNRLYISRGNATTASTANIDEFNAVRPSTPENIQVITISPEVSTSKLPSIARSPSSTSLSEAVELDGSKRSSEDTTPASFPMDHQILNMNDVSSSGLVVAQNFENYCRVVLFPSFNFASSSSSSQLSSSSASVLSSSIAAPSSSSGKNKISPYIEKKMKALNSRTQQPIWAFVSAAKTMFGRPDLYSGDYYQNYALVTTGRKADEYTRSLVNSAQCFIWYTGETAVAFELRNVLIDQLLVMVNGIVWDQTSSCGLEERELVIVSGLSPLSQYDIDFVNVNEKDEHELLASITVSTIHKNRILTESKHSTPLATLQESVVTTQAAIDREKLKLKKLKADWRKKSASLKAEIESLNNRANVSDETRNYKKLESLRQAVSKSENEIANLSKESEELYSRQTEIDEKYLDERRAFESELRLLTAFEKQYDEKLSEKKNKIKMLNNSKNPLLQKKEKLLNKKAKIVNDIARLEQEIENIRVNEIKFRQEKRNLRSDQRAEKYKSLMNGISKFEKQLVNQYQNPV